MPTRELEQFVLELIRPYGWEHLSVLAEEWAAFDRRRHRPLEWRPSHEVMDWYAKGVARYQEGFFINNHMRLDYAWERWFDLEAYKNDEPGGWRTIATGTTSMIHEQAGSYINAGGPFGGPKGQRFQPPQWESVEGHHSIHTRANSWKGLSYYRWRPSHWSDELTLTVWPHGRLQVDAHKTSAESIEFVRELDQGVYADMGEQKAALGGQPVGFVDYWRFTNGVCFIAERTDVARREDHLLCPLTPALAAIFIYKPWYPSMKLHRVIPMPSGMIGSRGYELGYRDTWIDPKTQASELLEPLRAFRSARPRAEVRPDPRPEFIPRREFGLSAGKPGETPPPRLPDVVPLELRSQMLKACGLRENSGAIAHRHFRHVPTRITARTKGRVVAIELWCAVLRSSAEGKPRLEGSWKKWVPVLVREGYLAKMRSERAIQGALRSLKSLTPVFESAKGKGNGYWIVHRDKLREMPADFLIKVKAIEAAWARR